MNCQSQCEAILWPRRRYKNKVRDGTLVRGGRQDAAV
jgi:hypothetical protein